MYNINEFMQILKRKHRLSPFSLGDRHAGRDRHYEYSGEIGF